MSFLLSLQPMLRLMNCIGIFLQRPSPGVGSPFRNCIMALGCAVFFVNLVCNGTYICRYLPIFTDSSSRMSRPVLWSSTISMLNYSCMTIGSQLCLIAASTSKWPQVVRTFRQMEKERFFKGQHYRQFGRLCVVGLAYVIAVMVAITAIVAFLLLPIDCPVWEKGNEMLHTILLVYAYGGGTMFSCLGWMTSDMLVILADQVVEQSNQPESQCDWRQRLDTWRHQHCTILKLVGEINHCYGAFLLLVIASTFVFMINTLFMSLRKGWRLALFLHLFILMIQFQHFAVLIYVPHRIRQAAVYFAKTLRCLELDDQMLQIKLNFLIVDALDSLPEVTALDLFDVNLRLVPSIVGTTLTYLIILCQFQYSED